MTIIRIKKEEVGLGVDLETHVLGGSKWLEKNWMECKTNTKPKEFNTKKTPKASFFCGITAKRFVKIHRVLTYKIEYVPKNVSNKFWVSKQSCFISLFKHKQLARFVGEINTKVQEHFLCKARISALQYCFFYHWNLRPCLTFVFIQQLVEI